MQPKYRSSAYERVSGVWIAYFSHKKFLFSKFMFAAKFVYWISGFDLMSEKKKVVALLLYWRLEELEPNQRTVT